MKRARIHLYTQNDGWINEPSETSQLHTLQHIDDERTPKNGTNIFYHEIMTWMFAGGTRCGLTFIGRSTSVAESIWLHQRHVSMAVEVVVVVWHKLLFISYSFNLVKIHELLCQIELIDGDIILEGNLLLLLLLECAVCDDDEGVSTWIRQSDCQAPITRHT